MSDHLSDDEELSKRNVARLSKKPQDSPLDKRQSLASLKGLSNANFSLLNSKANSPKSQSSQKQNPQNKQLTENESVNTFRGKDLTEAKKNFDMRQSLKTLQTGLVQNGQLKKEAKDSRKQSMTSQITPIVKKQDEGLDHVESSEATSKSDIKTKVLYIDISNEEKGNIIQKKKQ